MVYKKKRDYVNGMGGFGFMKKGIIILSIVTLLFLSGCGKSSARYNEVIENVISYNHEICEEHYKDSEDVSKELYWFEREDSNFTIWEDENNYYILIQQNYTLLEYLGEQSYADGYKIGKSNDRVSTSREDRKEIVSFYQSNTEPIYTEDNIELAEFELDMR